jgi:hypothetical protein
MLTTTRIISATIRIGIVARRRNLKQKRTKALLPSLVFTYFYQKFYSYIIHNSISNTKSNLLPDISTSLIAIPMLGSISKVVKALIRIDAEDELSPMLERRTPTPACSRI